MRLKNYVLKPTKSNQQPKQTNKQVEAKRKEQLAGLYDMVRQWNEEATEARTNWELAREDKRSFFMMEYAKQVGVQVRLLLDTHCLALNDE
jgi:hypothetical protein